MAIKKILLWSVLAICLAVVASPPRLARAQDATQKVEQDINQVRLDRFLLATRCLVCAGESLATSASPFANNLRAVIVAQFAAGKSDKEVREYLIARYGEAIFFRPPLRLSTIFLWLSPLFFLLSGFFILRGMFGKGRR
ncbi:MAG: cytochrome c-type biogenesis protein CcmH [Hydrotalea sp.]|nr:cytochrome c-type biogenesis protein CcmH [Hydrotalea sp.]